MTMFMVAFIAGTLFGVLVMAVLVSSGRADDRIKEMLADMKCEDTGFNKTGGGSYRQSVHYSNLDN
ncbi:MAG: hypothetical protein GF372_14310 [Candidatus Marinimicrobia bacterium]|nr:hypothetical protein [Candidatus Neomarinimicrobiota bacterium]